MNGDGENTLAMIERLENMGFTVEQRPGVNYKQAWKESQANGLVLAGLLEKEQEKVMIMTIALDKAKKLAVLNNNRQIEITCELALVEAGDEDYYDD